MLNVENLSRPGLPTISFSLARGTCLAVMGPSGSGKTLLLRALADLDPSSGEVELHDENRNQVPAPSWRRRVSYAAAEPGWWAETVAEHFTNWGKTKQLTGALLLPSDIGVASVARLSTGERQRLAVLRSLEKSPEVLLLDEPTGPLDKAAADAMELLLRQRMQEGVGILLSTHDLSQASRMADRILRFTKIGVEIVST